MEGRKIFVLILTAVVLTGLGATIYFVPREQVKDLSFFQKKTKYLPTFGVGAIEVIVFEDFLCSACRTFSESIFPRIAKQFIHKGRVRYRFAPIAFSSESKLLANAALGVYEMAPDRFFSFANALFRIETISEASILALAEEVGGIDTLFLKQCLSDKRYYGEIDANLAWLKTQMGGRFAAPMLLVNGAVVSARSFQEIAQTIQELER